MADKSYHSAVEIGELVHFTAGPRQRARVRAVTFTSSKVRYALILEDSETTIHNVDSAFVEVIDKGDVVEMPPDNYS